MKRILFLSILLFFILSSCSQTHSLPVENVSNNSPALTADLNIDETLPLTSAYSVFSSDIEIREYSTEYCKVFYPDFSNQSLNSALISHIEKSLSSIKRSEEFQVYDFCTTEREGSISFIFYDTTSASASLLNRFSITFTDDYTKSLDINDFIIAHDPLEHIKETVSALYGGNGAFHGDTLPEFFVEQNGIVVMDTLGNQYLIPDENFSQQPSSVVTVGPLYNPVKDKSEKVIALTFDDGPNYKTTSNLLKMLEEKGVKATFFAVGYNIPGNEFLLRRMLSIGCDVGIHSYAHQNYDLMTYDEIKADIEKCAELIRNATNVDPYLVRAPFGNISEEITRERQYFFINWCVDPYDYKNTTAEEIADHIIEYGKSGSIVLLHDLYERSCVAAELVIDKLLEDGWRFVTISELFDLKDKSPSGEIYYRLEN